MHACVLLQMNETERQPPASRSTAKIARDQHPEGSLAVSLTYPAPAHETMSSTDKINSYTHVTSCTFAGH